VFEACVCVCEREIEAWFLKQSKLLHIYYCIAFFPSTFFTTMIVAWKICQVFSTTTTTTARAKFKSGIKFSKEKLKISLLRYLISVLGV